MMNMQKTFRFLKLLEVDNMGMVTNVNMVGNINQIGTDFPRLDSFGLAPVDSDGPKLALIRPNRFHLVLI